MARARVVGRWIAPLLMVWAVLLWPVVGVGPGSTGAFSGQTEIK